MLSNVNIVKELGKNIVILPLQKETISSSYVNLTASEIAWSRADSKLLRIAEVHDNGILEISRRDEFNKEEDKLNELEQEISELSEELQTSEKEHESVRAKIERLEKNETKETSSSNVNTSTNGTSTTSDNSLEDGSDNVDNLSTLSKREKKLDRLIKKYVKEIERKTIELNEQRRFIYSEKINRIHQDDKLKKELEDSLKTEISEKKPLKFLVIPKHDTGLILTNEVVAITAKIGGLFHAIVKDVSYGRGHIATTLNPGWYGKPLIAVHNHTDKTLLVQIDSRFVKLSFHYLDSKSTITPTDLGGRNDIIAHLNLDRCEEYDEISKYFSSSVDVRYLNKVFNSIINNDANFLQKEDKAVLLKNSSEDLVKVSYDDAYYKAFGKGRTTFRNGHLIDKRRCFDFITRPINIILLALSLLLIGITIWYYIHYKKPFKDLIDNVLLSIPLCFITFMITYFTSTNDNS